MSNIPGYGRPGEILRRDEQGRVRDARDRVVAEDGSRFYPPDFVWAPQPQPPRPTRNSEPGLWEQAVRLWNDLVLGFGHPVELVRWVSSARSSTERSVAGCEISKTSFAAPSAPAPAKCTSPFSSSAHRGSARLRPPPASAKDMPRFRSTSRNDPLTWKVSFRMSVLERARARPGKRPRCEPRARRNARPYAYHIEALRRAIRYREDDVLRHARRLARRDGPPRLLPPERGRPDFREAKSGLEVTSCSGHTAPDHASKREA
jgi:hypothetical protein